MADGDVVEYLWEQHQNRSLVTAESFPFTVEAIPDYSDELTSYEMWWKPIILSLLGIVLPLIVLGICMAYICYKSYYKSSRDEANSPTFWNNAGTLDYTGPFTVPGSPVKDFYDCDASFQSFYANVRGNTNTLPRGMYPSLTSSSVIDAVRRGDLEQVNQYLGMNVSFKGQKDGTGQSVLHLAIDNVDVEMLKLLLEGAESDLVDVFERNSLGQSPIVFAASQGLVPLDYFILLVEAISNARRQPTRGGRHYSMRGDYRRMLPLSGENVNEYALVDDLGRNVIHYAALNNLPQAIHFLSSSGADVDYLDFRGDAPIHLATRDGLNSAVQALLDCGAIKVLKDADGLEPVTIAENRGFFEIVTSLRNHSVGVYSSVQRVKRLRRNTTSVSTPWGLNRDQSVSELEGEESPYLMTPLMVSSPLPNRSNDTSYGCPGFSHRSTRRQGSSIYSFSRSELPPLGHSTPTSMSLMSDDTGIPTFNHPTRADLPDFGLESDLTLPAVNSFNPYETDAYEENLPFRYRKYSRSGNSESIYGLSLTTRGSRIRPHTPVMHTFQSIDNDIPHQF